VSSLLPLSLSEVVGGLPQGTSVWFTTLCGADASSVGTKPHPATVVA
jgi:hypothetical protein